MLSLIWRVETKTEEKYFEHFYGFFNGVFEFGVFFIRMRSVFRWNEEGYVTN